MKQVLLLLSFLFLFFGCRNKEIIEEDKFVKVYSEILIASDSISMVNAKNDVFKRHNVSESSYEKTVNYYNANPEEWELFFNKVIAHIEELKKDSSSAL